MGGIEWTAIPLIVEMFGVVDVELFLHNLATIRKVQQADE